MGLFSRKITDPVRANALVAAATGKPSGASSARCRMNLVVTIPGQPSTTVETTLRAHDTRWPFAGMTLPVEVSRNDPSRLRVLWDEIPTARERSASAAASIAAQLNGLTETPPRSFASSTTFPPEGVMRTSSVTINGQPASPEEIARFEALTGMDLNGDGITGSAAATSDDRVAALERLAALHASGALTADEFAAEKRRLLES